MAPRVIVIDRLHSYLWNHAEWLWPTYGGYYDCNQTYHVARIQVEIGAISQCFLHIHMLCPCLQDMLQYRKKLRPLRVRTLDSSIKTLLVDDSQTVAELTRTVCARIGGCKCGEGCGCGTL